MVDLLPCPFCGSSNVSVHPWMNGEVPPVRTYGAQCDDCHVRYGPLDEEAGDAAERWNQRPSITQARAEARAAALEEVAAWLESQRKDVPAHGWEFAAAIRALIEESP